MIARTRWLVADDDVVTASESVLSGRPVVSSVAPDKSLLEQ